MSLQAGDAAPDFLVLDADVEPVSLSRYSGKVLLVFFRDTGCPVSKLYLKKLRRRLADLDAQAIGFWASPRHRVQEDIGRVGFPQVPDPAMKVYQAYGVQSSVWGWIRGGFSPARLEARREIPIDPKIRDAVEAHKTLEPAEFLIEDGRIVWAHYGDDIADYPDVDALLQASAGTDTL